MKIWWVFAIEQYYPSGGMDDLKGTFETEEEAKEFSKKYVKDYERVEIINIACRIN